MKLKGQLIEEICEKLIPEFAPLPRPFVYHLLQQDFEQFRPFYLYVKTGDDEQENLLEYIWRLFVYYRSVIYNASFMVDDTAFDALLFPEDGGRGKEHIQKLPRLSGDWLLKNLGRVHPLRGYKQPIEDFMPSAKTLYLWRKNHLLVYDGYNKPGRNRSDAILIMRALLKKKGAFLPNGMAEDEPDFWVWYLLPGETTPGLCAISSIKELPAHALVWSMWPGTATSTFDVAWTLLPDRGALRWAGAVQIAGKMYWTLTPEQMRKWQSDFEIDIHGLEKLDKTVDHLPHFSDASNRDLKIVYFHSFAEGLLARIGIPFVADHIDRFYGKNAPTLFSLLQSR